MYHLLLLPGVAWLAAGVLPGPAFWRRVWTAPVALIGLGLLDLHPNTYISGTFAALVVWAAIVVRMVLALPLSSRARRAAREA